MEPQRQQPWRDRFLADPPKLAGGVELDAELLDDGHLRLRFRHGPEEVSLLAAFLSVPYPSGLGRLVGADDEVEAVVVEHIPSGLDAAAEGHGVSYLDQRGFGRVIAPGFVYIVPPRAPLMSIRRFGGDLQKADDAQPMAPSRPNPPKRRVSPFAPKASRLVRAFLAIPERAWRLSEMANEVNVDPGNAHRVLGSLVDMGLVDREDDRYVVADPGSLLEAWAEVARRPRDRLVISLPGSLRPAMEELVSEQISIAISGEFAAELMAPYLEARQALIHCLDSEALEGIESLRGRQARPLRPEGRIVAASADSEVAAFGESVDGFPLVSPGQLYVDLYRERGRAREAAEHVRRERLNF